MAWDLIMRLRSKAWIKANLNPDNVPTRHHVVRLAEEKLGTIMEVIQSSTRIGTEEQILGRMTDYSESFAVGGGNTPSLNWEDWEDWDRLFCGIDQ
jgi:hypothetical protein